MRLFECDISGLPIYFENTVSIGAGNAPVGFVPTRSLCTVCNGSTTCSGQFLPAKEKAGGSVKIGPSTGAIGLSDPTILMPSPFLRAIIAPCPALTGRKTSNDCTRSVQPKGIFSIQSCVSDCRVPAATSMRSKGWSSIFWRTGQIRMGNSYPL